MSPQQLTEALVGFAPFIVGSGSLGLLFTAVCGAMLLIGRPVPAAATVASAGIPAATLGVIAILGLRDATDVGLRQAVGATLIAPALVGAPAMLTLLLTAVAGLKQPPRRRVGAALGAAAVALVIAALVGAGYQTDDFVLAGARMALYGSAGVMMVGALVAGGGGGQAAAAAAPVVWAILVMTAESGARAIAEYILIINIATQPVERRAAVVQAFCDVAITPGLGWTVAIFVVVALVSLIGVAMSARERPALLAAASGLIWLFAAAALPFAAHPSTSTVLAYVARLP